MNGLKCMTLAVFCCLSMGCAPLFFFGAGSAAGVVGYKYYHGALTVIYQAPFMETWDATFKAVDQMNIKAGHSDHDLTSGKIKANGADKRPVTISFKYKSARETEVVIRVGCLGDKQVSMAIKDKIKEILFEY